MRHFALLLNLLTAPAPAAPRAALPAAGRVISSIGVETHDVFDTSAPPENKLLYRTANRLHIRTRDPVVERELLFAVGDAYDPLLVAETERNLRALPFIRRAEIDATANARGGVDLLVRTYDSWTLEIVANYKRAGGRTDVRAGFAEHNILGQGKSASAVYGRDGGAGSNSFAYQDLQFLRRKRLQYSMLALSAPGSRSFVVSLIRPFYSSVVRRSAGAVVGYGSTSAGDGATRRTGEAELRYGVALATSTARTRRLNFAVSTRRARTEGAAEDLEQLTFLKAGLEWEELDFLKARRIQNFTQDEDFNLGFGVVPSVAWAPAARALGSTEEQFLPSVLLHKGFTWSAQLLLLKSSYGSKYVNGANGNRVAAFDAAYYVRGLRYQTLAFHCGLDLGWRLDESGLLTLGESNGLRGYGLSRFAGDRRLLLNAEDRVYVYDNLFRVLDVGAVVFYDSGYAWPAHSPAKFSDLKSSVGLGLRAAPSRSGSNSPVRVDVAFPLDRRVSASSWSLSILAGQAF